MDEFRAREQIKFDAFWEKSEIARGLKEREEPNKRKRKSEAVSHIQALGRAGITFGGGGEGQSRGQEQDHDKDQH